MMFKQTAIPLSGSYKRPMPQLVALKRWCPKDDEDDKHLRTEVVMTKSCGAQESLHAVTRLLGDGTLSV